VSGYSATPLVKKLGIKEGHTLLLLAAPPGIEKTIGKLPDGVQVVKEIGARGAVDVAVFFKNSKADLVKRFMKIAARLDPNGGLWIAWPKKASGMATDMTENVVREVALPKGLVDNKVCAIDETWSGLRLVYRLENRPKASKPARPARASERRM
jgi:hypothetical protein